MSTGWLARMFGAGVSPAPPARRDLQLANGMTVILQEIPSSSRVSVVVLHPVGGNHDPEGASGLAHLLEHIYLTGAAADIPVRSAEEAMRSGQVNAQTGEDYTVIAEGGGWQELDRLIGSAAARMTDLRITDADLARERPRLLDELRNMFEVRPALAALNRARERARPTPRGGRRGGNPDHVAALTADDLRKRWTECYGAAGTVVSIAGRFQLDEAEACARRHLEPVRPGRAPETPESAGATVPEPDLHPAGSRGPGGCAAVAASLPLPDSEDYSAVLLVASRLWREIPLSRRFSFPAPLTFAPCDMPEVIVLSASLTRQDSPEAALAGLRARIAEAATRDVTPRDAGDVHQEFGAVLGTGVLPARAWAANPYGCAFGAGRRLQLGLDPVALKSRLEALDTPGLHRMRDRWLAPPRLGSAVVWPN